MVCWAKISKYQKLSLNFIKEYGHKINLERLLENENLDIQIKFKNLGSNNNNISNEIDENNKFYNLDL